MLNVGNWVVSLPNLRKKKKKKKEIERRSRRRKLNESER